jgi:hypothetical protein
MPNIGAVLKQEIARLSRREIRGQVEATRKASAQYRRHIATLRRQIATLERQMALLQRRVGNGSAAASGSAESGSEGAPKLRFVAKGLKAQRARLGLSAVDYARLVGRSTTGNRAIRARVPHRSRSSRNCAASESAKRRRVSSSWTQNRRGGPEANDRPRPSRHVRRALNALLRKATPRPTRAAAPREWRLLVGAARLRGRALIRCRALALRALP